MPSWFQKLFAALRLCVKLRCMKRKAADVCQRLKNCSKEKKEGKFSHLPLPLGGQGINQPPALAHHRLLLFSALLCLFPSRLFSSGNLYRQTLLAHHPV